MHTDNNTLRTLPFGVNDKQSGKRLTAAAHAVNVVWNPCNGAQIQVLTHNKKWSRGAELERLTKGAGKLIGIPAQSVQGGVGEARRAQAIHAKIANTRKIREWTCGSVHNRDVSAALNIVRHRCQALVEGSSTLIAPR
jgi:hypothetical protein